MWDAKGALKFSLQAGLMLVLEPALEHLCTSRERGSSMCGHPALPCWSQPAFSSFQRKSPEEATNRRYKTLREPILAEG